VYASGKVLLLAPEICNAHDYFIELVAMGSKGMLMKKYLPFLHCIEIHK
jgi:hypothetical protein